jgi:hypothetical protein
MIFVFVREDDFPLEDVPPLAPRPAGTLSPSATSASPIPLWPDAPSVLDEGAVALGMHRTGQSNWRIACENGFDNAHIPCPQGQRHRPRARLGAAARHSSL